MPNQRIISLLPAATEIICALGLEHQLVGRSHECDYPANIANLPVCSSAKFISGSNSAEIDRQVKEILSDSLSIYEIDRDLIKQLSPDVIITQAQCEVCAVSLNDVELALKDLLEKECQIISLQPNGLDDIYQEIQLLADQLGVPEAGAELLELSEERINIIQHKLKFISDRPSVACVEWLDPLMIAGNWTPEIVEIAGGTPVLTLAGKHSSYINFEDILKANPDILVLMPCGFSIQRTLQEINLLLDLPGWTDLKAVQNQKIFIVDGNQYFNRSGPRITDSIEIMAEIINPKQFVFGNEGNGWLHFRV
ncbi:cobalamin-binding protein [Daejeonella sp.]|jgi:iron complex transport system substrate-binding protein|uniref:cobalamin-binding protein n=1 Tax=Daejeonella sp. TaxID=2805397 RepID=UPI0037849343